MALKPGKYTSKYNISDTILDRVMEDGVETFRGSGSDYSELADSIYIASVALKRVVALKAFIETVKYNIAKTTEITEEKDKNSKVYTALDGDMDIDITLNIPAHSTNEAVNNLAKIEELQRLISPNSGYRIGDSLFNVDNNGDGVVLPVFRVWFKNIISMGSPYVSYSTPLAMDFSDIMNNGFPCVIESVVFEPAMDAGFFQFDNFLYPKVIKLNLKLIMEVSQTGMMNLPIEGFTSNGQYTDFDNQYFPFSVRTLAGEIPGVLRAPKATVDEINELDYSLEQGYQNPAFFMSIEVKKDSESIATREGENRRWVVFKPFLESFTRTHGTSVTYAESKERVGKIVASDQAITFKDLSYKFKLLIPAKDVAEAKRNCAKIQYLMRMFYRPPQPVDIVNIDRIHRGSKSGALKKEYGSLSNRRIRVYSPSFIEKAGAANEYDNLTFDYMYENGIPMFFSSLAVDINFEMGFFEEDNKLYPKELSIDLDFMYDSNDLIKTYVLNDDEYSMQSSKATGEPQKFPYNRQTSTIKLG